MSTPGGDTPVGGVTPSSTYTPFYSNSSVNNARFNPTMAVIIIVLIGGCFVLGFISVFVRKCMSGVAAGTNTAEQSRPGWTSKTRGLDKEAVDALPIVHSSDLDERNDRECPVCLTEFEPEDNLRLLPNCKHVFHQECIDAWFDAHSTCPLCRVNLTGFVSTSDGEQGASRLEPARAIVTEVSESDIELQPTSAAPLEDSILDDSQTGATVAPTPARATISREDSLNSARGTLTRNSQSFKRAARGATALEKAQSLGAAGVQCSKPPTTPTASRKPPLTPASTTGIRRSSSLGTDLIALRNLLMGGDQNGARDADSDSASYRLKTAKSAAPSTSWFATARSMDAGPRNRNLSRTQSGDNWVAIDLESGKPSAPGASTSKGESSSTAAPEQAWSDRWSLASLRGAMFPLSRSSSDVTSHVNPRLPV